MGVALITPFRQDKSIDFPALARLLEHIIRNNADYIVVLGTTAETATLTEEEKEAVRTFVVERVNRRVPLVLGLGGNNTKAITDSLQRDDFSDFCAILSVVPYYNKPSQEGMYQHYKAIAEASPLPVILYNVPGRTGVNMTAETTLRLARDFENIVGIGVISVIGNAFPYEFGRMVRLALDGDYHRALMIHHRFTELFSLLFVDGNPAGVKCVLNAKGFIENELRLPLVPTKITTYQRIREVLRKLEE